MKRWIVLILALSALQCADTSVETQTTTPEKTPEKDTSQVHTEQDNDSVRAQGLKVTMLDEDPTEPGEIRKPIFEFETESATINEVTKIQNLTGVSGTVYREAAEDLKLQAQDGVYDENAKTATLEGAVSIQTDKMAIQMESVTWYNTQNLLQSNSPIELENGDIRLGAEMIQVYPKKNHMILHNGHGTIKIKD